MPDSDRKALPYPDDFRRAKRNSLLWSGLAVLAALGSPPAGQDTVTFVQLGTSLGFTQSAITGTLGLIAIYMAVGFVQAMQRLRIFASHVFVGSSAEGVEQAFNGLASAAGAAQAEIDRIVPATKTLIDTLEEATTQGGRIFQEAAGRLSPGSVPDAPLLPQLEEDRVPLSSAEKPPASESAREYRARVQAWRERDLEIRREQHVRLQERFQALEGIMIETLQNWHESKGRHIADSESTIEKQVDAIRGDVAKLRAFHEGIYLRDRWWFWSFDVLPVAALFIVAMIPFVRLFL